VKKIATACLLALLISAAALADDVPKGEAKKPKADAKPDVKEMSGISILGNREAPKSLVIVPWKSSSIGDSIGISRALDNKPAPVDRGVFERELSYYRIKSSSEAK
jgi:hypothetical protein